LKMIWLKCISMANQLFPRDFEITFQINEHQNRLNYQHFLFNLEN
jgi:hypothetical protein